MKHKNLWKQCVAVLLALVLSVGLITPSIAVDGKAATESELTFEQVDNDSVNVELPMKNNVATDEEERQYADTDIVRVSIVLSDASTLEKGYTAEQIARSNSRAVRYRKSLETKQQKMEKTISKKALNGEPLDVVWNLTLAANIISANVEYGQIEAIEKISGVEQVLIETRYEPCVVDRTETADPNMATSDEMIGSISAWAAGYTGAGSKIAIIDTGADTDHPSLDPAAFSYALKDSGVTLMTAADTEKVLSQLNASKFMQGVTAEQLYVNAKIPFGFNYIDKDLDITHDNDTQGDHGSHVTGIAAGNRYIANGDGTFSKALDSVLTQGVAPDAQVLTMKVFGKEGGAFDADYMAAIEDAMVLGADAANLSLGSSDPGYSHNAKAVYQELLERVTESGMVVAMSAGNSGNWFENTPYTLPYAESVGWQTSGAPSTFTNSLAVASADNIGQTGNYIEFNGEKLFYAESLEGSDGKPYKNKSITTLLGEHEFVYIDSIGTEEEFAAVKDVLNGKIAICNRGDLSFYLKAEYAVNNGAIATIIANNQPGVINMDLSTYSKTEPAVTITLADAQYIKENAEAVKDASGKVLYYTGKLNVTGKVATNVQPSDYYTMSDFSSWGVPGSLEMKPEITAPGGSIYSLKNGGGYQVMSGTSMASPQIAGMAALVAQYIKNNNLTAKTGLTARVLAQSLLMSTAEPVVEDFGEYGDGYYPVLRQGAGLANVAAAISSGSYLLMDSNATDSYKDGKIKVELGDDPDRKGLYTFGFTIYNMEDTDTAFNLDADFFTQDVFANQFDNGTVVNFEDTWTTPIAANVNWNVDGKTLDAEDASGMEHFDFNGDGKINNDDGQALLDYVTGVREKINDKDYADFDEDGDIDTYDAYLFFKRLGKSAVVVPANDSVHVTVTAQLSKAMLDELDEMSYGTGTYVEGFVFASELSSSEGVQGTQHSIPVLGYYGSWSEPSMYDIGSYIEYANGLESRVPYMYAASKNNALVYQALIIRYAGDSNSYYFGGNPYIEEDFYHEDRNAYNPETTTFTKVGYALIRNAAAARVTIAGDDGKEYLNMQSTEPIGSAFYYTNGGAWMQTNNAATVNAAPDAADGTKLSINLTMAPEYYVDYSGSEPVVSWDALSEGATKSYVAYVDKFAPEVSEVYFKNDVVSGSKQLVAEASDNRYIAAAALYDYDTNKLLAKTAGSPEDAKLGDSTTIAFDASVIGEAKHLLLLVYDYADNYSSFSINLNEEELEGDVTVALSQSTLHMYTSSTARLYAEVNPFGVHPDGVVWTSDNEAVATINQYGVVTAVGEGTATITATSQKDPSASATCAVKVDKIDVNLLGALQDANGAAKLFTWHLGQESTWTPGAELGNIGIGAACLNKNTKNAYVMDSEEPYSIYEINTETGETLNTYKHSVDLAYWDMAYSEQFSTAETPMIASIYNSYIICPSAVDAQTGVGNNLYIYLHRYGNAEKFTALTSAGATTFRKDFDRDGVEEEFPAEAFLALDDKGNVWTAIFYQRNGSWAYPDLSISSTNLAALGVDFPGYNGTPYCSLLYNAENGEPVLYLSYFDGSTNVIYRMTMDTDDSWEAAPIADVGSSVWPAALLSTANTADKTATDKLISTFVSVGVSEELTDTVVAPEQNEQQAVAATGSLNAAPSRKSEPALPLESPVEKENPVSNVTVSDDEKTVTVNIVAKSDDATTNGLATVDYDADVLTLTDVSMFADYTSHKDESGKVTLGYVDVDALPVGTVVATLTFSVDTAKVGKSTEITVHQTELNDAQADVTESLCADFHKDTEVRGAKDPTCTEKGYTGDTYCKACNALLEKGKDIDALGHNYKNGKCTRCGEKQSDVKTGDMSNMNLWFVVLTMSAAVAVLAVAVLLRKKRSN